MKARILPLDSDAHRLCQELLPWFVNGTLEADEAAQVAAHLARCGRCQGDAAAQRTWRATPIDEEALDHVEGDWTTLRSRLDVLPPASAPLRRAARPWWRRGVAIALAAQAVVVVAVLVAAWSGAWPGRSEPYRGLGAVSANAEANALAVFRDDATEKDIRLALRAGGARIVGGPTVTDAYLLHLSDAGPPALARLRAQAAVLRVESLQGEASR